MKYLSLITILLIQFVASSQNSSPVLKYGSIGNGDSVTFQTVQNVEKKMIFYNTDSTQNEEYKIIGGTLIVASVPGAGKIKSGGILDAKSITMMKRSKGHSVAVEVSYIDKSNIKRFKSIRFFVSRQ